MSEKWSDERQTVQTLIRCHRMLHSDLGLHSLVRPIYPNTWSKKVHSSRQVEVNLMFMTTYVLGTHQKLELPQWGDSMNVVKYFDGEIKYQLVLVEKVQTLIRKWLQEQFDLCLHFAQTQISCKVRKHTFWRRAPRYDSDQPAHSCCLIRIFPQHILNSQGRKVSSCWQQRQIRLHGGAGWFESLLVAYFSKYMFTHTAASKKFKALA